MALYEVRGLHKAFGESEVLRGVDLSIERGELVTIMGDSGSGKSLLFKLMLGLHEPDSGALVFDGQDMAGADEAAWLAVRRRIGISFQEPALFDSMSVFDNIAYGLREQRLLPEPKIARRVTETLAAVGLPGIEDMAPASLSGGMQKRVGIARAIAMRPEMVLYDEPTEGLDPINVTRVNRLMLALRERLEVTTFVATHNMRSAFETSDRLILLHEGKAVITGTPAELRAMDDPRLADFVRASEMRLPRPSEAPPAR
ncbi:MAG: ATP-binding cassette domain-containing protein [Myxococcota bacterium]